MFGDLLEVSSLVSGKNIPPTPRYAELFFQKPMTKPPAPEVLGIPPTTYPDTLRKDPIFLFWAKIHTYGAKIQIYNNAQTQISSAEIQIFDPNSSKSKFVPLKTSRFVRGNSQPRQFDTHPGPHRCQSKIKIANPKPLEGCISSFNLIIATLDGGDVIAGRLWTSFGPKV